MPEYNVPKVREEKDGILLQASGGKELVFTQIETRGSSNLVTLKFIVGENSISVMVTRATGRELLNNLAAMYELNVKAD